MKCGSQIAVAVVGGYVLGRSRKTRMAVLLALMAAGGGKLPISPEDLLRKSPLGGPLDKLTGDLRSQLVDAGMNVAKKAASSRIDSLSDRLQERADTLRGTGGKAGAEPEESEEEPEPIRSRRDRGAPPRRRREEPPRRAREPEYDEDEYDEYDDYDRDEDDDYEQDDEDRDDYDEPEPEPEREPETERRRRPPARSTRPEPRRRAPRRDDDRTRGRSPR